MTTIVTSGQVLGEPRPGWIRFRINKRQGVTMPLDYLAACQDGAQLHLDIEGGLEWLAPFLAAARWSVVLYGPRCLCLTRSGRGSTPTSPKTSRTLAPLGGGCPGTGVEMTARRDAAIEVINRAAALGITDEELDRVIVEAWFFWRLREDLRCMGYGESLPEAHTHWTLRKPLETP